ncbi:hypothetical protein Pcinc_007223 [Petrolisthes cinctipes]|uniref:C-type lectin domain-containing protein n=1 Tax=Petrolisthes cinctipes TaxID=88211 RepID=A0AAE1G8Y3_PETCI|nr:hypothetical protein Pcinc_007223 [Petrolisthes cinctipes]
MRAAGAGVGGDILLPRLLVVVWGVLLYHVLLMLVQVSDATVLTWYKVKVSQTTLQSNEVLEVAAVNDLVSAMIGSQNQKTHQLFCCTDTGPCRFYDVIVVAGHDDSANGPVEECWTWRSSKCNYGGIEYEDGDIFVDNVSCHSLQCQIGEMVTLKRTEPSPANVSLLVNEGCVFIEPTPMTFDDARNFCKGEGGDMYVAGNFKSLQEYLGTLSYFDVWVGARSRAWLDGRPVEIDEWFSEEEPNGPPNECICMKKYFDNPYLIFDHPCTYTYPVLCQKGVWYSAAPRAPK